MVKMCTNITPVFTALVLAGATAAAKAGDTLEVGQKLKPGETLMSKNGKFRFELNKIVVRPKPPKVRLGGAAYPTYYENIGLTISNGDASRPIWSSVWATVYMPVDPYLILQADGNLCLYAQTSAQKNTNSKTLFWMSGPTRPTDTNKRVVMQDDGNLCVYWKNHAAWWSKQSRGQDFPHGQTVR